MASRRTAAVSLLALAHASEKSGWFLNDDGHWEHTDGTIYGGGKTDAGKDGSGADDGKTNTGKDDSGADDGKTDADGKDGSGADDGGKSGWTLNDDGEWVSADGTAKDAAACGGADALSAFPAPRTCVEYAGAERCWYTFVPSPRPAAPVPLVVDMHGFGSCADAHARYSGWRAIAELGGAVVAWPQGSRTADGFPSWGAGRASDPANKFPVDDVGFLRELVARVLADGAGGVADPARVIMAGHSNGCMMAQRVALDASELVAAVGCSSGYLLEPPGAAAPAGYSPVPVVTVHGTLDPTVPYSSANVEHWARINGCTEAHAVDGEVTRYAHANDGSLCAALITLAGAGHSLAGGAPELVWEMVRALRRDGAPPPTPPPPLPPSAAALGSTASAPSLPPAAAADAGVPLDVFIGVVAAAVAALVLFAVALGWWVCRKGGGRRGVDV